MTPEQLLNFIVHISALSVVKLFFLLALVVYLFFAAVVVRQVKIMTSTFQIGFELPLVIIAWLHLFLVVFLFFSALFLL